SRTLIQEHISQKKIAGILLGLTGILIILLLPLLDQRGVLVGDTLGNLLIIGAMIGFALFTVHSRYLIDKKSYHPMTVTGFSLIASAGFFFVLILTIPHEPILPNLGIPSVAVLALYMAIFVTVLPYVLYQWTIKHSSATTASLTTYIQPVFAFLFNGILLGEIITPGFLVGSALVFSGVFLATGSGLVRMAHSLDKRKHHK
ncbi:DMT family transporter, partial [Candidatus Gottesmanbacteria bacterium]|nr:DMT family transporter [Candidatus Gottesmanbacteria bacterium]